MLPGNGNMLRDQGKTGARNVKRIKIVQNSMANT